MRRRSFRAPPVTVATILEPEARSRIDTAAGHGFRAVHAGSVREARTMLRSRPVGAVLLSAGCVRDRELPGVRRLVTDFPGVPLVALMSSTRIEPPDRLLRLGASGVRRVVDITRRDGWRRLREIVNTTSPVRSRILKAMYPVLEEASPSARDLFEAMVWLAPATPTVRALCQRLRLAPSTFVSRFFRAGLPSPKRYLAAFRLVHAAALLGEPGLSIADVAYRLEYSSPQSFGRHVRAVTGVTAGEFRRRSTLESTLDGVVRQLLAPYRAQLRTFRPM